MGRALLATALLSLSSYATPLAADECSSLRVAAAPAAAHSIGLLVDDRLPATVVDYAVRSWAVCPAYGRGFPSFEIGREGTRTLFVHFDPTAIGPQERCGRFAGRTITLFARTRTHQGSVIGCGSLGQNLMHELGHALGLADAPRSCDSFAMAKLNPRNAYHRRVRPGECRLVDRRWRPLAVSDSDVPPGSLPTLILLSESYP